MSTIKIRVENYQAIRNAELEVGVGLTAIVGPTNSGKSSIIRAIRGSINNQTGTGFINYEAPETRVTIVDNGNEIIWTKPKKGSATYTLNGVEISKVGRTQNEEVAELLNMSEIEVNNTKIRLNFWDQMEKAFLMDKTPNQLFEFISQSKEQEVMTRYQDTEQTHQKELEKEIKEKETRLDVIKEDIYNLTKKATELAPFNAIETDVIENLQNLKNSVETNLNIIIKNTEEIHEFQNIIDENLRIVEGMKTKTQEIKQYMELYNNITQSLVSHETHLRTLEEVQKQVQKLQDRVKNMEVLKQKLSGIITQHSELADAKHNINTALLAFNTTHNTIKTQETQINGIKHNIRTLENELKEFKICPFCGSELGGKHNE